MRKAIADGSEFEFELPFELKMHQLASAADQEQGAVGLTAVRMGPYDSDRPGAKVIGLGFKNLDFDFLSRQDSGHEHDPAVDPAQAQPARGHFFHTQHTLSRCLGHDVRNIPGGRAVFKPDEAIADLNLHHSLYQYIIFNVSRRTVSGRRSPGR